MAYRDYGEGRGGPGGGYDERDRMDRMDREGGRGWMDRARDYFERAREAGRDLYERERAERYGRGGAGYAGGQDYDRGDRYERDRYDRDRYDRDSYGGGYGGASVRERGHEGGQDRDYGRGGTEGGLGGRSAGSMGGNSYVGSSRPDLGDRNPGQGFGAGSGATGGSYYGQGTPGGIPGAAQYGGRQSYAGRGSKNYRRSDARIEEEVHEVLMRHHEIDATDVDVRVANGEVTLTGEVEDRRSKRLAEEIVEQLPGVRDVHNELRARRGLLGDVANAAMSAVDPARPGRDREPTATTTIGVTRGAAAGGASSSSTMPGGATGGTTGGTTTGGTTDLGAR